MVASLILLSNDGKLFPISNEAAQLSETLKTIMEEEFYKTLNKGEKMSNFIVPMEDTDGSTLQRIVDFMNHHVTEPMNQMAIITTESSGDVDGDGDDTEGEINETTVTTTPNADDHTTGDPAIITMPGADQPFYESFLTRPTTKGEISMILRGATELMIPPLLQYMYVECTMYMALVWGRIPTFPEIYAAFILGIDDSYINVPLDEATCRTHHSRLSCSRRLARLQSQSQSQPRKV